MLNKDVIKSLILLSLIGPNVMAEECSVKPRVNHEVILQDPSAQINLLYIYKDSDVKAAEVLCEADKKMQEKLWSPNGSYLGLTNFEYQADFTFYRIEHNKNDKVTRKKLIDQMSGNLLQVEVYNPETSILSYINYYDGVSNRPVKRDYFKGEGEFSHSSEFYYKDDQVVKFSSLDSDNNVLRSYDIENFSNAEFMNKNFSSNVNKAFTTIIYDNGYDLAHADFKSKIHTKKEGEKITLGKSLDENKNLPYEVPRLLKNKDPRSSGTAFLSLAMKGISTHSIFPVSTSEKSSDIEALKSLIKENNAEVLAINLSSRKRSQNEKQEIEVSLNSLIKDNPNVIIVLNDDAANYLNKSYSNALTIGVFNCSDTECLQVSGLENPTFATADTDIEVSRMGGGSRPINIKENSSALLVNHLQKLRGLNPQINTLELIKLLQSKVVENSNIQAQTGGLIPLDI